VTLGNPDSIFSIKCGKSFERHYQQSSHSSREQSLDNFSWKLVLSTPVSFQAVENRVSSDWRVGDIIKMESHLSTRNILQICCLTNSTFFLPLKKTKGYRINEELEERALH
jgi:hypothetical protein